MSETSRETDQEASSRRTTHVVGSLIAAAVLIGGVASAPSCQRALTQRRMKTIQSVVRLDLDLISEKEKKFFDEHKTYTTDLRALKVFPKDVLYKFGFVRAGDVTVPDLADHDPKIKDLDALKKALPADAMIELSDATRLKEIDMDRLGSYCADCTASRTGFKAIAAANLDADAVLDLWTVDEKGQIQHLVDDLSQ